MTCTKSTSLFEREYAAAQQEAASRHITLFSREGMQYCGTLMCCTTVGVCIAFWPWQLHLAVVQLRRGPHASDGREQVCGYVRLCMHYTMHFCQAVLVSSTRCQQQHSLKLLTPLAAFCMYLDVYISLPLYVHIGCSVCSAI